MIPESPVDLGTGVKELERGSTGQIAQVDRWTGREVGDIAPVLWDLDLSPATERSPHLGTPLHQIDVTQSIEPLCREPGQLIVICRIDVSRRIDRFVRREQKSTQHVVGLVCDRRFGQKLRQWELSGVGCLIRRPTLEHLVVPAPPKRIV